jgi:hypothetical protein
MADDTGKLPRRKEADLIAESAIQYARLELEKVAQHILDMLRLPDEGLVDAMDTLDRTLLSARRWMGVWEYYVETLPTKVAHPIPDHEDDVSQEET